MGAWIGLGGVVVGAALGGLVGYLARASEFRRDQRLRVYSEFMGQFLAVARHGAILGSYAMQVGLLHEYRQGIHRKRWLIENPTRAQPGEQVPTAEQIEHDERFGDAYAAAWDDHDEARIVFDEAAARLRLIASNDVIAAAAKVEDWLRLNVEQAPPFKSTTTEAGEAAQTGPSVVAKDSVKVARTFADEARIDVAGRWPRAQ